MNNLFKIIDKIGREVVKMEVGSNSYANYFQKAIAKSHIDGYCDFNTYLNRDSNYLSKYYARKFFAQTGYY